MPSPTSQKEQFSRTPKLGMEVAYSLWGEKIMRTFKPRFTIRQQLLECSVIIARGSNWITCMIGMTAKLVANFNVRFMLSGL